MGENRRDSRLPTRSKDANVDAFLERVAATPAPRPDGGRGRLMFAMDATASRAPTWDTACQIQGQMFEETAALAEGVGTTRAALKLSRGAEIEMPIVEQMYAVLYEGRSPREALEELMLRSLKRE